MNDTELQLKIENLRLFSHRVDELILSSFKNGCVPTDDIESGLDRLF